MLEQENLLEPQSLESFYMWNQRSLEYFLHHAKYGQHLRTYF